MEEEEGNGGKEVALLMVFRKSKCCKCGRYPLAERRREFGRVWFRVRCSCGARTDWATDIYGRRREKAKARSVQHWELINKAGFRLVYHDFRGTSQKAVHQEYHFLRMKKGEWDDVQKKALRVLRSDTCDGTQKSSSDGMCPK